MQKLLELKIRANYTSVNIDAGKAKASGHNKTRLEILSVSLLRLLS